ncbi:MAG: ThuA domain-containing protein [Armatimonadetes bacterium]|nr:ThuA domain-containing protein [Armatimonadota bacterium]
MPNALVVWGGWDGHEPDLVANLFREILEAEGWGVEVSDSLDAFADAEKLNNLNLIVPVWTMGNITPEQRDPVIAAVRDHGVGIAGCHGGMCDSFRNDADWQFMTGGQFVAHPGNDGTPYRVNFTEPRHEITQGLEDFDMKSEQYYMHVDPGLKVLATTDFPNPAVDGPHIENSCKMPVVWVKMWGKGRVFYNSLGHHRDTIETGTARELMRRGFLWAAK